MILTILLPAYLLQVANLLVYGGAITAGEMFAFVAANGYESTDVWYYCVRYVMPYWLIVVILYLVSCYSVWWFLIKKRASQRIVGCAIVAFFAVLLCFPIRHNIYREIAVLMHEISEIHTHQYDSNGFCYHATRTGRVAQKEIYVLSIGESLRYRNMSLNGIYPRQTTPMLEQQTNLCLYSDYYANATLTQHALPLLFTPANTTDFNGHFNYKTIASAFSETGFTTVLVSHRAQLMNNGYHNYLAQDFDTIVWVEHDSLIAPIMAQLAEQKQKLFVVTHYLGNHMFYTNRTEDCLMWRPDYNADTKTKSDSLFLNAYDNSILYTDRLLSESIDSLRKTHAFVTWLFVSDHGEYISSNVSGHGHTYHPTKDEYHVPLMVWYSDEYKAAYPEKVANAFMHKDEPVCADYVFWSVLDMANIQIGSTLQQKSMSIFEEPLKNKDRTLLLPNGESIKIMK